MNPYTALEGIIPPKYRKYVYTLVALASLAFAAYAGANGDWSQFIVLLLNGSSSGMAAANTTAPPSSDFPTDESPATPSPGSAPAEVATPEMESTGDSTVESIG